MRQQLPYNQNGSVTSGGNNYAWTGFDSFHAVNGENPDTSIDYLITFTLQNGPIPAGQLVLGSYGLGQSTAGGNTLARVLQNGSFLGDWDITGFGPTGFFGGPGIFQQTNSLSEPTPGYFNSDLGVTRINDSISSLTIQMHHIGFDGLGLNIGRIVPPVPEPGSAALGVLSVLVLARRRR